MKTEHIVRNVDLEDDWARRFIRQVQASISVTKTQVQAQVPCTEKKS